MHHHAQSKKRGFYLNNHQDDEWEKVQAQVEGDNHCHRPEFLMSFEMKLAYRFWMNFGKTEYKILAFDSDHEISPFYGRDFSPNHTV